VPSDEVPGLYHDFVRRGEAYRLVPVFHHNLLDVITMGEILRSLCRGGGRSKSAETVAQALIYKLANRHPEFSFVLVGPEGNLGSGAKDFKRLQKMPNVYLLGSKQVEVLPGYIQHFDVCMLCYLVNDYTKYIFPLKINEYLATGKPVVGVPIRSLQMFKNVIRLANTVEEWSSAIKYSLAPVENTSHKMSERKKTAMKYDWDNQVLSIARSICEIMGSLDPSKFETTFNNKVIPESVFGQPCFSPNRSISLK
jgi:glycosyltransferase involved in cell wall biosynthesis